MKTKTRWQFVWGFSTALMMVWSLAAPAADSAVQFDSAKKTWLLQMDHSAYAFGVAPGGELIHLWWGGRLAGADLSPAQGGRPSWDDTLASGEYPAWGGMRYDECAIKVKFADGVRDLRLKYRAHALPAPDELIVTLQDTHYPFEVDLHYRVRPRYDLIERWAVVKNQGQEPVDLEQVLSAVWHPPHLQKWTLTYLAGRWGAETQVRTVNLDQGKFQIESRHGSTSHQLNPWFAVSEAGKADESGGEVWFGELAWSGSWKIAAEITDSGRLQVAGGIHDFDFNWHLKPDESFSTPVFVAGFSAEGMGGASRRLHAYQLAEVLPKPQNQQLRPVIYNSWYATTFDINVEQQIKLARQARDLGVELFMMDDGWFGARDHDRAGLGDWYPSKTKFPQGLKPLTDAVHGLGMTFGLWVEPEMVNPDSDLYRAHPDWVFQFPNRPATQQRNQLILNFAKPEVQEHLFTVLDKLLSESGIDCVKWDMNRHISEPGWTEMPQAQQKEVWVRHTQGVYRLIDRLRAKHPQVLWESCSGGGGRADIGILRRMDQVWASDNTDPLDRLFIQEGYTHAYAPKTMVAWVTDNPDGINQRSTSLAYRFHSAMMGTLGVGGNLLKFSEAEKKEAAFWVAEYKQARPLVQEGLLYRLRSPRESGFSACEYAAPDQSAAVVFAFLHSAQFGNRLPAIRLHGLQPQTRYQIEARMFDPKAAAPLPAQTLSGAALMERGLTLRLKGDFASALVRVERIP